MTTVLKIFLLSFAIAVVGRYGYLGLESWQNERRTADLCAAVGNYLETGNLREAFEGLEYGAARAGAGRACINILDNGRSYAPNCVDQAINYQTVTCRAEANAGVRALIMYPREALFNSKLVVLWGWLAFGLMLILYVARYLASYLSVQMMEELRVRIIGDSSRQEKRLGSGIVEWILNRAGIIKLFMAQAQDFEEKIRAYESRLVSESALRAQKETEATKATVYIERIRKVRHDIRSPLSGLLAVQEAIDPNDELLYSTCSSVARGLRSLVEKLNDLEAEELTPRLTILEVLAEQATQGVRLKFSKRKNISLALHYDSEKLSPVFAVPDALLRIFENLLENAFDALPLNGAIEVHVSTDASHCQITFEDNGCGIAPEIATRLFQEGATHGKVGGTGLGLYHAKKSLAAWNGTICHKPKVGGGTRFLLTLPLAQTGVVFKGRPNHSRVIVVDDDPKVPDALERSGYDVAASAATFEAGRLLLAAEGPADTVALVDQDLGGGRLGTDLIAEVPGRRIIHLCTNDFDNPEVVRRAKQVGVSIIPKPLILLSGLAPARHRADDFELLRVRS
ncbi:MAG: hypothetical protein KF789_02500 [Bdellovibrionaceae bacterium]|nr:hypothetical protein [Pseudobdellovibrionaceae bacterium]